MIRRLFNRCLLRPEDLPPSQDDLKVIGVFNPGATATTDGITLLVRVVETFRENRPGWVALPRWNHETGRIEADWFNENDLNYVDPRVVVVKTTAMKRLTFTSYIRVMHSRDGRTITEIERAGLFPENENEEYGVEDPRITELGGVYYVTYVAVSRHGVATALASSKNFKSFTRYGIIFPPENKDVVLFPEKIGDDYVALHRPNPAQHFSAPAMWLASSPDLIHWGNHRPFLVGKDDWNVGRVGAGTPPIRTEKGWLEIYHGNDWRPGDLNVGTYSAGALLLDFDDPGRILAACGSILVPETDFERSGFLPNVVFPTGIVCQGDRMLVYYGAADESVGMLELSTEELIQSMATTAGRSIHSCPAVER